MLMLMSGKVLVAGGSGFIGSTIVGQLWKEEREQAGWTYSELKDETKKTNPLLVEYDKMTDEGAREYNRDFIRSFPRILALADYTIVDEPDS
jgi:nucleoside-diphosphate-sugar epimerase